MKLFATTKKNLELFNVASKESGVDEHNISVLFCFCFFFATFGLILAIYNITGGVQSFLQSFDIITPLSFSLIRLVRL